MESEDLADLIRSAGDRGMSYSDIAKAAGISKAKVGQLAQRPQRHVPRPDTLRALAKALNLPLRRIREAAYASAGVELPRDSASKVEDIVGHLQDMTDDELDLAEAIIMVIWERRRPGKPWWTNGNGG